MAWENMKTTKLLSTYFIRPILILSVAISLSNHQGTTNAQPSGNAKSHMPVVNPEKLQLYYKDSQGVFGYPETTPTDKWVNRLYNGYNWYANGLRDLEELKQTPTNFPPTTTRIHENTLVYKALGLTQEIYIVPIKDEKTVFAALVDKDKMKKNNPSNLLGSNLYMETASMEIQLLISEIETLNHTDTNPTALCKVEAIEDPKDKEFLLETPFRSFQFDWIFKKVIRINWHLRFIEAAKSYVKSNAKTCDSRKLLTCKLLTPNRPPSYPINDKTKILANGNCVCANDGGAQTINAVGQSVCCRHFGNYQEEIRFFNPNDPLYPSPHNTKFAKAAATNDFEPCKDEAKPYCSEVSTKTLTTFKSVLDGSVELDFDFGIPSGGTSPTFKIESFFMEKDLTHTGCAQFDFYKTIQNLYRRHEQLDLETNSEFRTNKYKADETWMYSKKYDEICRLDFQNDLFHSHDISTCSQTSSSSFLDRLGLLHDLSTRTKNNFALCKLNQNMICTKTSKSNVFGTCQCMEGFHKLETTVPDILTNTKKPAVACVPGNDKYCNVDPLSEIYIEKYEGAQKLLPTGCIPIPPNYCFILPPAFKQKLGISDLTCGVNLPESQTKLKCEPVVGVVGSPASSKCVCRDPTYYGVNCKKENGRLITLIIKQVDKIEPGSKETLNYGPFGKKEIAAIAQEFNPEYEPCTADVPINNDLYIHLNELLTIAKEPGSSKVDPMKKSKLDSKVEEIAVDLSKLDKTLKYCIPSVLPQGKSVDVKNQSFVPTYTCKGFCYQRDYTGSQIDTNITALLGLARNQTIKSGCEPGIADKFKQDVLIPYYKLREEGKLKLHFTRGDPKYNYLILTTDNSVFDTTPDGQDLKIRYEKFLIDLNEQGRELLTTNGYVQKLCSKGLDCNPKTKMCECKKGSYFSERKNQCYVEYWNICSQCPKNPYYPCIEDEKDKAEQSCRSGSYCKEVSLNDPRRKPLKVEEQFKTMYCVPEEPETE